MMAVDLYHASLGIRPLTLPPNYDAAPCRVCKRTITRHEASFQMNCCRPCYLAGNGPAGVGYDRLSQLQRLTTPYREFSTGRSVRHPQEEDE